MALLGLKSSYQNGRMHGEPSCVRGISDNTKHMLQNVNVVSLKKKKKPLTLGATSSFTPTWL